jgi:hypothetical protein
MRQNWSSKSPALSTSPPTRAESEPQQLPARHGLQAAAGNVGLTVFPAVPARRNRGFRQFGLSELLNSRETRFAAFYCEPGIEGAREGQRRGPGRLLPPQLPGPGSGLPGGAERAVAVAEQAEDGQRIGARIRTIGQDFAAEVPLLVPVPDEPFETGRLLTARGDRYGQITRRIDRRSCRGRYKGRSAR